MNKLTLTAFPVKQGDTTLYLSAIPAGSLIDEEYYRIDRWNATSQEGYQREVNQSHAHRLSRYLGRGYVSGDTNPGSSGEGIGRDSGSRTESVNLTNVLPGSIVLNFRNPFKVTVLPNTGGAVGIEVDEWPAYIIDGQHRIEGVREDIEGGLEELIDYEFPVTICQFNLEDEMIHFRNLNTTANRPPKGLNEAISHALYSKYNRMPSTWIEAADNRATGVTMRLSSDSGSPWFGKIALGGVRKRSMHVTVQSQFTHSIRKMFTQGRFSDPDIQPTLAYQIIRDFWSAVEEVWPTAMANTETYIIQRNPGFNSLNLLLNKIFNNITINPTRADMVLILEDIKRNSNVDDEAWNRSTGSLLNLIHGYAHSKGYNMVADFLWSALDERTKLKVKTTLPAPAQVS